MAISLSWALILLIVTFSKAPPEPPEPPRPRGNFSPPSEAWRGGEYSRGHTAKLYPDTGLVAKSRPKNSAYIGGYPMHSSIIVGVSDTITIIVEIMNRNEIAYDISSQQVDNWFMPVVYDIVDDPHFAIPLADTTKFDYSFEYWRDNSYKLTKKPDSLIVYGGSGKSQFLFYYVWNLPFKGRLKLQMQKTVHAPVGLKMLLDGVPQVWITKPRSLADTITAYMACVDRAYYRGNKSAELAWTDSILALNPTSIPGYWARAIVYDALDDSLSTVASYDSLLAILYRYGDPAMPDSADQNRYQSWWYYEMIKVNEFHRWRYITGDTRGY